jgi:hypothetical protein
VRGLRRKRAWVGRRRSLFVVWRRAPGFIGGSAWGLELPTTDTGAEAWAEPRDSGSVEARLLGARGGARVRHEPGVG